MRQDRCARDGTSNGCVPKTSLFLTFFFPFPIRFISSSVSLAICVAPMPTSPRVSPMGPHSRTRCRADKIPPRSSGGFKRSTRRSWEKEKKRKKKKRERETYPTIPLHVRAIHLNIPRGGRTTNYSAKPSRATLTRREMRKRGERERERERERGERERFGQGDPNDSMIPTWDLSPFRDLDRSLRPRSKRNNRKRDDTSQLQQKKRKKYNHLDLCLPRHSRAISSFHSISLVFHGF